MMDLLFVCTEVECGKGRHTCIVRIEMTKIHRLHVRVYVVRKYKQYVPDFENKYIHVVVCSPGHKLLTKKKKNILEIFFHCIYVTLGLDQNHFQKH